MTRVYGNPLAETICLSVLRGTLINIEQRSRASRVRIVDRGEIIVIDNVRIKGRCYFIGRVSRALTLFLFSNNKETIDMRLVEE